ncbi:hypothetical protein K501DRAFT_287548 [Backusella circina FSU 941]|nr:hypothetical protein K501DRAFT_287548 [Backusella circina FSU 941]
MNNDTNNKKTLLLAQPFEFKNKQEEKSTITTDQQQVTPTDIVDDAELLAILGIPIPVTAVLDWDDMPELSESDSDECIDSKKRKHDDDDDDDLFAGFDFEPTIVQPPPTKKRSFVEDITFNGDDILSIVNEEDMLLACELSSS